MRAMFAIPLWGLALVLLAGLCLPTLARAQGAAEVEKLVATLEDEEARVKLIAQLRLLVRAQDDAAPTPAAAETGSEASMLLAIPAKIEESVWSLAWHWGGGAVQWLTQGIGQRLVGSAISILSVLLLTQLVWRLVSGAIRRYLERTDRDGRAIQRSGRVRTLLPLLRLAVRVVLTVMVVLIVLSELGVNIAPLLAGAGVVGIAIGFGAQKLVQDIITGFFILVEDTLSVGDVVSIAPHSGVVEGMSIRVLKLRDFNGNLHSIPFSSVSAVINMGKEFAYAVIDAGVSYDEDVDRVATVLREIGDEMAKDPVWAERLLAPLEVLGLERFEASAVVIRSRFRTQALQQWAVLREFNRRMKRRFQDEGIAFPYPQTTLWFGEDKAGQAPPVHVRQDQA